MKAPRPNGFTLLELLVAVTVLGLIMVGVVEGVRFGIQSWDSEARQLDTTAELDGIDRVLRELAHGISPVKNGNFVGRRDGFRFVGRLPMAVPTRNRAADLLLLVTEDHRLVLRWTPHRHAADLLPRAAEVELLRNVRGIELSYWPAPHQGVTGWQSSFSGVIPRLIRLHIVFMDGDPRHWPDFIASPMITGVVQEL